MAGGTRTPSWKERENNKCRERRRRAVAAKIFAGLRLYGNYTLPKHCDNNEVLKALCNEAGWTVEPDGTTYRKGCKPVDNMDFINGSISASTTPTCSSFQPSPCISYNPTTADGNSLIPWLRNLSSSTSSASSSKLMHHYMHSGSISAPVTPPSSSPTAGTPRVNTDWDGSFACLGLRGSQYPLLPLSTPPSPGRHIWYPGTQVNQSGTTSPTFSLVSSNPFGFRVEDLTRGGSLMCTPGQSGTCSPAVAGSADIPMSQVIPNEFAFGSNMVSLVKPWEGETIHEECGEDELELTLGSSKSARLP
ncbi:BES1/BZR1-like protein 4 [Perilla frutescens var. hirtella]|uniref:Protein BZR1 homolog n=1 Tax=Perilla frutescens var. hirtella TaxID=608512 RepID=A0AAD4PDQ9_PERFH|nr:BES1/BZR1-like protein 4 [Perilla frutescens var. frutescens]KAH6835511.1 BES1/BZR1-like protein 4 [Perilla frutescens var. hirtella]